MTTYKQWKRLSLFILVPLLLAITACTWIVVRLSSQVSSSILRESEQEVPVPKHHEQPQPLFHLVHTTSEESFQERNLKALESIFFHHPDAHVTLHVHNLTERPLQSLLRAGYKITLKPIQLHLIADQLLSKIPAQQLNPDSVRFFLDQIPRNYSWTPYWYTNQSNLLRLALMFLEGGVYMDTDVILVKPLFPIHNASSSSCACSNSYLLYHNVVAWEDKYHLKINMAVMKFQPGNPFLVKCLQNFFDNFAPTIWGHNGPKLITRVWRAEQNATLDVVAEQRDVMNPSSMLLHDIPDEGSNCSKARNHSEFIQLPQLHDVTTLEYRSFYPIRANNVRTWCMKPKGNLPARVSRILQGSFTVHTNYKNTGTATIQEKSLCHWLYNAFCVVSRCSVDPILDPILDQEALQPVDVR